MKRLIKNITGQRIAEWRRKTRLGLTQLDLSNILISKGIRLDRAAIAKIERGFRGVLDYEILAIAEALKMSSEHLLTGHARYAAPRVRRTRVRPEEPEMTFIAGDRPLGFID
jgi:transcriptional regulator with XRE-family HTH domain